MPTPSYPPNITMPTVPTHVIVICPLALIPDALLVLGLDLSNGAPLCTEADPPIRSITHKLRAGSVTTMQRAAVDAHIASPSPGLEGIKCYLWLRSDPSPQAAIFAECGVTQNNGSMG